MRTFLPRVSGQPIQPPVPFAVTDVSSYAELAAAISGAAAGTSIEIHVTANFPLTGLITIDNGKTVILTSGSSGPFRLTRDVSGYLFTLTSLSSAALFLTNIIIDGNRTVYPSAGGSLIRGNMGNLVAIGHGAKLINNSVTTGAGGVAGGILQMTGGRIANNQGSFGGGINSSYGIFNMYGGIIENNAASADGGGVYNGYQTFTMYGGTIRNNTAHQHGGGVSTDNAVFIMEGGTIQGNTVDWAGGGVYVGGFSGAIAIHGGLISGNTVLGDATTIGEGGGIALVSPNSSLPAYTINGDTVISNNSAPNGNGGGISIPYSLLPRLAIGSGVLFSNNSAGTAYQIAPMDIPMHDTHVLTHSFTTPFVYGYNNFDIAYTAGTPTSIVTVTFASNGGTLIPSETLLSGDIAAPPPNPIRNCDLFTGWYTDSSLTNLWNFSNPVLADMTFYAGWQSVACAPCCRCEPGIGCAPDCCAPHFLPCRPYCGCNPYLFRRW